MKQFTIIIDDGHGSDETAYLVRADGHELATAFARDIWEGHFSGVAQIRHILSGRVEFLPRYTSDKPLKVLDLGTAQFGDDA